MADPRPLSDMSSLELREALSDAEERVDLSRYVDSQNRAQHAQAELDALRDEYRRRKGGAS